MIPREFYERDPLICARELIGTRLVWGRCSGIVVETEAYDVEGDEACHTFFRPSTRAFVEKHQPGMAYVYLNYGVHWMLNVLVKGKRQGFVLFRALEPVEGIDAMIKARRVSDLHALCSGPGKLTQAIGVTGEHHGIDLCERPDHSFHFSPTMPEVLASKRIGISKAQDLLWRFSAATSPHVSGFKVSRQSAPGARRAFPNGTKPQPRV